MGHSLSREVAWIVFFLPVILIHCSLYIVCCSVILLVFFTVFFTFWCLLLPACVLSWRQQLVSFIVHIFLPHQAEYFIGLSADVSSSWLQSCGIVGFMRLQWLVTATCSVWLHVAGWAVGNVCSFLIICCEGPACFWPTMRRRGFFSCVCIVVLPIIPVFHSLFRSIIQYLLHMLWCMQTEWHTLCHFIYIYTVRMLSCNKQPVILSISQWHTIIWSCVLVNYFAILLCVCVCVDFAKATWWPSRLWQFITPILNFLLVTVALLQRSWRSMHCLIKTFYNVASVASVCQSWDYLKPGPYPEIFFGVCLCVERPTLATRGRCEGMQIFDYHPKS